VREVEQRTFSGERARQRGQRVLYVTERCVFRLAADGGLELIEIAPGIDLERQILAQMDFTPAISPELRLMEPALFEIGPMNLRERMLALPLAERIEFDPRSDVLFINFEGLIVDSAIDIVAIEDAVVRVVAPLGRRVDVVVNYDHFDIRPELVDAYTTMVDRLTERHYRRVTRYAASGFMKARLEHAP
jgi:propionate CoA-transferase